MSAGERVSAVYEIYEIRTPSGKLYYGQHKNYTYPKDDGYMGSGVILQRSFKKYGKRAHIKTVLYVCASRKEADMLERQVISEAKSRNPEMVLNVTGGGTGGYTGTCFLPGHFVSEKTRKKQSDAHKGKVAWNKGIPAGPMSMEQRAKLSAVQKGHRGYTKGMKFPGRVHKSWGRHSEETKQRMRKPKKPLSEEVKQKISASRRAQALIKAQLVEKLMAKAAQ